MANETTGRESDKFMLRLPDGMRERLRAEADTNNRSMNAEIVSRLQESLDGARQLLMFEDLELFLAKPDITSRDVVDLITKLSEENSRKINTLVDKFQERINLEYSRKNT